jgi:hypothetical protein
MNVDYSLRRLQRSGMDFSSSAWTRKQCQKQIINVFMQVFVMYQYSYCLSVTGTLYRDIVEILLCDHTVPTE